MRGLLTIFLVEEIVGGLGIFKGILNVMVKDGIPGRHITFVWCLCASLMVFHSFIEYSYEGVFYVVIVVTENCGNIKGRFLLCLTCPM